MWSFDSLLDDGVNLYGGQAYVGRFFNPIQDPLHRKAATVHLLEYFIVEGVEANRNSLQSRVLQGLRLLGQQVGVGRKSEVNIRVNAREHTDEVRQVSAEQRFAAGNAKLIHSQTHEEAGKAGDLLEAENLILGEELVALAENFGRHTVGAPKVAPVGYPIFANPAGGG